MRRPSPAAAMGTEREVRVGCPGAALSPRSLGPRVRPRPYLLLRPRRGRNRLPGVRCAPRPRAPVIQVALCAQRGQVLLWVLSPRLSPGPRPACICRTRRPLPTQAQGPGGRGEGGRACAQGAGLGEAPLPGSPRRRPGPSPPRRPPHHASPEPGQAGASRAPRPTASLRGGAAPHSGPRT